MATGDRIFLADKDTLDSVKRDTTALMSKSDSILDSISSNSTSDGIDNNRRSNLRYGSKGSGLGTSVDILNLPNSSGKLYLVMMQCRKSDTDTAGNSSTINVIVDGTPVYNPQINLQSNNSDTYICLIEKSMILSAEMSARFLVSNGITANITNFSVAPYSASSTSSPIVVCVEPIKWTNSLKITAQSSRVTGSVYYYYELD